MWRVEDHTADVQIVVEAAAWPELLEEATLAFAHLAAGGEPPRGALRRMRKIALDPATPSEAWVQWWRALLRLWTVEGLLPVTAGVRPDSTPERTHAVVRCVAADELDARSLTDVKAVTRHDADVAFTDDRVHARIVLDV